jgi:hypothetical protein
VSVNACGLSFPGVQKPLFFQGFESTVFVGSQNSFSTCPKTLVIGHPIMPPAHRRKDSNSSALEFNDFLAAVIQTFRFFFRFGFDCFA